MVVDEPTEAAPSAKKRKHSEDTDAPSVKKARTDGDEPAVIDDDDVIVL